MATTPRPELSSVFDDMLTKSRSSLDELYRRGAMPGTGRITRSEPAAASPTQRTPASEVDPSSEATRRLNERFGRDWRYEIVERRRDGDEVIVLAKLTFGKDGAVRSQFGRAKIGQAPVTGRSGDVRFRLASGGADDEHAAFRHAAEAALTNCIDLL